MNRIPSFRGIEEKGKREREGVLFFNFSFLVNIYNPLKYHSIIFIKLFILKVLKTLVIFQSKL